ncbi:PLP-dependent transferase [Ramaria rubella]|nr:PLP-dependent transferase [Ramaria rubella]
MSATTAFFYGTLLHPDVLKRVLGNNGSHLKLAPAVLLDFTRHHVKGCDYPAIVPYASSKDLFKQELTQDERSVRGTAVIGLTEEDIRLLDIFEGDEYIRQAVSVSLLEPFAPLLDSLNTVIAPETPFHELNDFIVAETYVWDDGIGRLAPETWSFDVFVKEKLWRWVGRSSDDNSDYSVVDERRAMNGSIKSPQSTPMLEVNEPPEFGHALLSQFLFHKDYVNLNHGSYGSVPRPVAEALEVLSNEIESRPDRFIRTKYNDRLTTVRERLANLVGAKVDEIVIVPNATHGINTVLRNFEWSSEDVLVGATTTYGAISRTLQYIHDIRPHPKLSTIELAFPTTHAAILNQFRAHLRAIPREPGQKVVAIVDSIVSNPGCVLPWERMVEICKEENVWSVLDAAHSIGQQVGINLEKTAPDFWISNCHKWLFAKRGCAVLYVPRRNQHLIKSTFPTSHYYVSPEDPKSPDTPKPPNFVGQFNWTGTLDVAPYLSVIPALEFRAKLGGEERINEYCHTLAVKGGKRLAQLLRTSVMPEELTANMTNVVLPLPMIPSDVPIHKLAQMRERMQTKLLEEWDCFVPVFPHNGKWWTRCSAQVWNEISDFDHVGKALSSICAEFRKELAN